MIRITWLLIGLQCNIGSDSNYKTMKETAVGAADYVLPYPVGTGCKVSQGNYSRGSHSASSFEGVFKFSYDFRMPIGSVVTAAREGEVVYVQESFSDDDHTFGHENVVAVRHGGGTYTRYVHLTKGGAVVQVGEWLSKGDTIGYSGNSGYSLEPHLHFDVVQVPPGDVPGIRSQSVFVSFVNSAEYPNALKQGTAYEAGAYRHDDQP